MAALLYRVMPRRLGEPLGQFAIMLGFRWLIGVMRFTGVLHVDLRELDRLRDDNGIVLVPNHPTMLDAVLIMSRLPRVVCITKAALWDNWALGGGIRLAGYMPNDAPLPMMRRAAQAVQAGNQLLIFPEGSRTATPPVGHIHRSFAVMAKAAGAPVQAVLIEADSPYLAKGWPLFRRPVLPLVFRVRLGERFIVGASTDDCVARLERHYRAELPGCWPPAWLAIQPAAAPRKQAA
ncbi:1-acyl-sn-glycerol-3-phosphate acyltransferase [Siccirubricoccus deserti]|uniref:1-acyl-sn-glycerol-3-phosphate acyltransferase n=1 Tax=Siccirubricoccus deserti TaxID=2013562 RepID=A0A9X0R347_9PROT|nr:lysophospholipid acyltransferase family protein [Siccirubricoccus deserti]MBC4018450.1 1-acyl-sn-glycerol-3-phosphate acyltransferase [Siccirubricoccus deserti]GGC66091.1 1-acyl-sn-glycerol-3-phosphate acyltransferase [Siccirubricoccus deserti]